MEDYFVGIDPGQTNQGIAIISKSLEVVHLSDTGQGIPENRKGKGLPDIVRNSYVYYKTKSAIDSVGAVNVRFCVMEGPNYSSKFNVTPISIGSIHGQNQIYFWDQHIDFAVIPPRSIQVAVHGTSCDITKAKTKAKMLEVFGNNIPKKFTSNMSDALAMAYLARQFWMLITGSVQLSVGEQKTFLSESRTKNGKRGLVYQFGKRVFIFNSKGDFCIPNPGETLAQFYFKVKQ